MKNICVYASGSRNLDAVYQREAQQLGELIAQNGMSVIFGGGTDGLMGALARGASAAGGSVIGVIPDRLNVPGIVYEGCAELYVTKDLRERKAVMEQKADAFIALPGGFGTLEELLEIITLRHLGYHQKPIAAVNTNGFYSHLQSQFEEMVRQGFAARQACDVFRLCADAREALGYIGSDDASRPYIKNKLMKKD